MFNKKTLVVVLTLILIVTFGLVGCSAPSSGDKTKEEPKKEESKEQPKEESKIDWSKYPDKPITVVISYKPGGGSDVMAQAIQPFVEKYLGTSFVNVYKPGANGSVGWTYLVNNTKADGFTIAVGNTPPIVGNPIMKPEEIKYTMDDIVPIYNVVEDPGVLVVKADSPIKTLDDFIKYAKEHPKTVTVGNSGVGGDDWISTKLLEKAAGIELVAVPFAGDGPSWQAALGGHIVASSNNMSIVYKQIVDGSLRPLAIYSEERSPYLPDVPTAKELGYDIVNGSGRGYVAKKGTPEKAIEIIAEAFEKALNDPEFKKKAEEIGLPVVPMDPETYGKYFEQRAKDFKVVWEEVNK